MEFDPEPDLHPLYPTTSQLSGLLASDSGLDPSQKAVLVKHCLKRASLFGDVALAQFLVTDSQAQTYVDLSAKDEDGVGLVSLTIHGFGGDPDRDIEREEAIRYLVSQGADLGPDRGQSCTIAALKVYLTRHNSWVDPSASCSPTRAANLSVLPYDPWMLDIRRYREELDATRHYLSAFGAARARGRCNAA